MVRARIGAGCVVATSADQRDVADLELEAVQLAHADDERVEFAGRHVVDPPALLADEMPVCAREVEERRAVPAA